MPLKVRDVVKLLEKSGWAHVRTSGDHRVFRDAQGRTTVVSGKMGDDVRPGTFRAIPRQTGIKDGEQ
jgi:predicted RNA binding protein YcfA (HicA-like mRNA interferase family)